METIKRDEVFEYINNYIAKNKIAESFKELKLFCAVEGINTTKQQIKTFLRNQAKEDGVDLNPKINQTIVDLVNIDDNLIKRSADRFIQEIKAEKYKYHREDLQYFNDLFRIYTKKCLKICSIISMIRGRRMLDKELMQELDITINEREILLSDVDRLLVPLVHNYCLALDAKFKAEQMYTYLDLNVIRYRKNEDGLSYYDMLPNEDLQDYFQTCTDQKQFIALTDKQKEEIDQHTIENFRHYLTDDIDE